MKPSSSFLSVRPQLRTEAARGSFPKLPDASGGTPFDHAVPAAFGGWHRTLNTVSALISFVRDKWINRRGVVCQDNILPNFFPHIDVCQDIVGDFAEGHPGPLSLIEDLNAARVLHAPNLHGDSRNEIAPEHPKFSATEWKSTSHVRS